MQSLNDVVREGKVLYLGVSDTPGAWSVSSVIGSFLHKIL